MQQLRLCLTEMVNECHLMGQSSEELKNRIGTLEECDKELFNEAKKIFAEFARFFLIYPNTQIDTAQFIENVKVGLSWFGVDYPADPEFNERVIQAAQDPGARQMPVFFGVRKGNAFCGVSFCKFIHCSGIPLHYASYHIPCDHTNNERI